METGIDRDFVEDYYHRMTDKELLMAVAQDARNLTEDAYSVIDAELKRRRLTNIAAAAVAVQRRALSSEEIYAYLNLLQNIPCPCCGQPGQKLQASCIEEVVSFFIASTITANIVIACHTCLDNRFNKAQIKTFLLGWWELPRGPYHTIRALLRNSVNKKSLKSGEAGTYFVNFINANIGEIEMYKNDQNKLSQIICNLM